MNKFKKYRRKSISEMRPVTITDRVNFMADKNISSLRDTAFKVSVSVADLNAGSPKMGDMIARNPKNHEDQWLVAKAYFEENLEEI